MPPSVAPETLVNSQEHQNACLPGGRRFFLSDASPGKPPFRAALLRTSLLPMHGSSPSSLFRRGEKTKLSSAGSIGGLSVVRALVVHLIQHPWHAGAKCRPSTHTTATPASSPDGIAEGGRLFGRRTTSHRGAGAVEMNTLTSSNLQGQVHCRVAQVASANI